MHEIIQFCGNQKVTQHLFLALQQVFFLQSIKGLDKED